jgi:hypothetical protein
VQDLIVLDMSLEASPAQQVHIERHHRAIELLNRKLALIPKRILPMGDYPSIHQFYEQADSLHIPDIPPEYQLLFLLKHYNTIVAAGGLALKQDVRAGIIDLDVAKAVCFWRLDRVRTLDRLYELKHGHYHRRLARPKCLLQRRSPGVCRGTRTRLDGGFTAKSYLCRTSSIPGNPGEGFL